MTTLLNESRNIIIAGDLNAKHPDWGCPQVDAKGCVLANWLNKHNLYLLNAGVKTSLRFNTTIDLVISGEILETSENQSLFYTGSDHLPILTKFCRLNILMNKRFVPRTYWKLYSPILIVLHDQLQAELEISTNDLNNTYKWFLMFEQFLAALKLRVTAWRYEEDRLRLRSWNTLVKQEFQAHRQRSWEQFISNVASSNPTTF